VQAFAAEGLLAADFPVEGKLSDADAERLAEAAHLFLGRCKSKLMMVQIEDILALDSQMNLPGTTTQHPNWRRRFPKDVASVLADPRLIALAQRLKEGRGNS